MIVQPVVFAVQMVVVSQKISQAVMFHCAHQDFLGHIPAEDVVAVVADADLHRHLRHLQHSNMQNRKVPWSSQ